MDGHVTTSVPASGWWRGMGVERNIVVGAGSLGPLYAIACARISQSTDSRLCGFVLLPCRAPAALVGAHSVLCVALNLTPLPRAPFCPPHRTAAVRCGLWTEVAKARTLCSTGWSPLPLAQSGTRATTRGPLCLCVPPITTSGLTTPLAGSTPSSERKSRPDRWLGAGGAVLEGGFLRPTLPWWGCCLASLCSSPHGLACSPSGLQAGAAPCLFFIFPPAARAH